MSKEALQAWFVALLVFAGGAYFFVTHVDVPKPLDPSVVRVMTEPTETYIGAQDFTIMRPATAEVLTGDYNVFLPVTQNSRVGIALLPDLYKDTSLKQAVVFVGSASSTEKISACLLENEKTAETRAGTSTIAGIDFSIFHSTGKASGEVYDVTVHRAIREGVCWEIVELLQSTEAAGIPETALEAKLAPYKGYLNTIAKTLAFKP